MWMHPKKIVFIVIYLVYYTVKPSADKWKSSFKPLGEEDDAPEQSTGGSAK